MTETNGETQRTQDWEHERKHGEGEKRLIVKASLVSTVSHEHFISSPSMSPDPDVSPSLD